jgi:preprotein translocase subunit YajC
MTIGGFIGELTYIDFDANLARIKLTEDLEVKILPGAISGKRVERVEPEDEDTLDDEVLREER